MTAIAGSGLRRGIVTTSVCNVVAAVAAGAGGVIIARSLGPTVRGEYAAITAWFGIVLVVGELGQTAATTYFVARDPHRGPDYLATSRNMMVISGLVTLGIGLAGAPLLADESGAATSGYRVMFATCLAGFVGASYTFSLQASNLKRWNLVRTAQPVAFAAALTGLYVVGWLDLMTVLGTLSITIVAQTVLAYWLCVRQNLTGGRAELALARPMTRYGISQVAASLPQVIATRLDQLVLSIVAMPALLGNYAVAASLTGIAGPVVAGLGGVVFPLLASRVLSRAGTIRLQWRSVATSAVVGVGLMLPLAVVAPWLVPAVFGAGYRDAAWLVVLLAPGGVFSACGRVCGDLLRGYGRPFAVARALLASAAATVVLLATLVPLLGVAGAALASSMASGLSLLLMLRQLTALSREAVARSGGVGEGGSCPEAVVDSGTGPGRGS